MTNKIQKGNYVLVFIGNSWVKRKIIQVQQAINGTECYIVRYDRGITGRVYQDEIKAIN